MIALSPPHVEIEDDDDPDDSLNDSIGCKSLSSSKENKCENSDLDGSFLEFFKFSTKNTYGTKQLMKSFQCIFILYLKFSGTRPPLPSIELGPEYDRTLEIFYVCTDQDLNTRPSARGIVRFFENYVKEIL